MLRLPGLHRLALHIDAAAEVCTLGDGHARRHDVAVHRPAVADVTLLGHGDVVVDCTEDDQCLGEDLRLDRALDLPFDRVILTPVQRTLDDDRFPDIHNVSPVLLPGLRLRQSGRAALLHKSSLGLRGTQTRLEG